MFRKTRWLVLAWAVLLVALLAGCTTGGGSTSTAVPSAPPSPAPAPASEPGADAGVRPLAPAACTVTADADAVPVAAPGDVVCLTGDRDDRLTISTGGTDGAPITYSGGGSSTVRWIDVTASNVVVEGFTSKRADNMGARLQGDNITFRDNTISKPQNSGDDTDGLRFFGNGIQIVHNTISDVSDGSDCDSDGCGDGPHPDCMQTFYSDQYPTSSNITIQGNSCKNVAAQCLMAEGPVLPEDGINGPGESANWTYDGNYCDSGAAQALMIRDIKNLTITNNYFDGTNNKAIALADGSTGAHVDGNRLNPRIHKLITFDDGSVAQGYVGPPPEE
jgi:pectate lyase